MDRYQDLVNSPVGKKVARQLGLPRPALLRRYSPGDPLLPGPLLIGGGGLVTWVTKTLSAAGVDVRSSDLDGTRWGAVVYDATDVASVGELGKLREFFADSLKRLLPSGRLIILARAPESADDTATAVARQALDGLIRSVAKELRAGATANMLIVDESGIGLESAMRFLLSGRSAYVDGQVIRLGSGRATEPSDWERPLSGKTAVVTGAARGIGAAIARTLARDGARVVCVDLPSAGESLAKTANQTGGSTFQLDIAAPDAPARLLDYVVSRYGSLSILVNNAGITRDKLMVNMRPEQWDSVIAVNLESQLRINDALLSSGHADARVVCLASTSGIAGNRGQTNYAASKAGVIGMVRALAPEFGNHGGVINAVAPGFIDTEMTAHMPFATREVARRLNSLQQAGLPIDVAETVAFLSSPASSVNGQVIRVCGQNLVGA